MFFRMSWIVIKALFSRPATVRYPFVKRQYCRGARGRIDIDIAKCIFCGICQKNCPAGGIEVDRTLKQWAINRMRCITCGACVEVCPKKCLVMVNQYSACGLEHLEDIFKQE